MKEYKIKIYNYDELSQLSKDKVLRYFIENDLLNSSEFLEENLTEVLKEKLKVNKISFDDSLKIRYSLNNCQGDGFSFIGDFTYKGKEFYLTEGSLSNHYSHKYTVDINEDDDDKKEDITQEFKNLYFEICDELEKIGYSEIEANESEEVIKENIEANGYMFTENGQIEY